MTKRILALLLAAVMVFSLSACGGDNTTTAAPTEESTTGADASTEEATTTEAAAPTEPVGQIIIGDTTELSGDWLPYIQNNAADYNIWKFISGQGTVDMTFAGEYVINESVVKNYEVITNDDGSKTYKWTIKDGLKFDDGTPITAKDYVASPVLWSSKTFADMGGKNDYGYYFKGWSAFSKGENKVFEGVRLLDESTFSVTIAAENLPFFYELALASVAPTKLSYWTDENVTLQDDGEGVYLSDNFTKDAYEEKFMAARDGINLPATGAYRVKSYDAAAQTAVLEVNPNYPGAWDGQKPMIETIIYKKVLNATAMDELKTGSVDLLSKMAEANEINGGLDLVDNGGAGDVKVGFTAYPRAGYGRLLFACDFGPTKDKEVRQAIAHLLDRNDFAKAFTGGFGSVVNGPYGEAMWFYQETRAELNEKLDPYAYSLEKAVELLEAAGWVYDEKGGEYKEGLRYKKGEDGKLMPLVIEWSSSEQNTMSDLLVTKLQENPDVAAAGMKINQTVMTFNELLNYLYRDASQGDKYGVPTYGMYNLGIGFTPQYDPSLNYTTDPEMLKQGYNVNFIIDEDLDKYAKALVLTDPEDRDGFKKKFVNYIDRWNDLLPDLPLYSNIYHDFYNAKLQNYNINALVDLTQALQYAYVTE